MSRRNGYLLGGAILAATAIAIVAAVLLSGGSDSDSLSGVESAPGSFAPSEEFQDCLAEQGIEIPEPGAPPTQPFDDRSGALEACAEFFPDGMGPPPGGGPGFPGG